MNSVWKPSAQHCPHMVEQRKTWRADEHLRRAFSKCVPLKSQQSIHIYFTHSKDHSSQSAHCYPSFCTRGSLLCSKFLSYFQYSGLTHTFYLEYITMVTKLNSLDWIGLEWPNGTHSHMFFVHVVPCSFVQIVFRHAVCLTNIVCIWIWPGYILSVLCLNTSWTSKNLFFPYLGWVGVNLLFANLVLCS